MALTGAQLAHTIPSLRPEAANWAQPYGSSQFALLAYERVRTSSNPRATLLDFLESAYQAGATLAAWDRDALPSTWCPTPTVRDNLARHRL